MQYGRKNTKNKTNLILITLIIILLIATIGLSVFILFNKDKLIGSNQVTNSANEQKTQNLAKSNDITKVEKNEDVIAKEAGSQSNFTVNLDTSKIINTNRQDYHLKEVLREVAVMYVDKTQKILNFNYNQEKAAKDYGIDAPKLATNSNISFDKKIVDILFGSTGQTSIGDTLFILLEDGTIEYIPLVHAIMHKQSLATSYGKVNGIKDVVRLSQGEIGYQYSSNTVLAVKNDGSFYDLGVVGKAYYPPNL